VIALGDGGAHYALLCDASYPSYMLTQRLGRDGLDLATLVRQMTSAPAASLGLDDRGVIAPGYKADLNVIDLDKMVLRRPTTKTDLPAGGKRLTQTASGYVATIVSGVVTYQNGEPTGALPGRLVRGAQPAPVAA
jgi:N-acyl-D-aspartate/D-glutamate deacylase